MASISKSIRKNWQAAKREVRDHPSVYLILAVILISAAFLRLFRLNETLGFYYDQGRDALVIWRLFHEGKLFLVGPVTGIEGIFLGPFYYLLIAPFYFLGGGDPVLPAAALGWVNVAAIGLAYLIGKEVFGRKAGILTAFLWTFSYQMVTFTRWLANPNPLPAASLLAVWSMIKIAKGESWYWLLLALVVGLGLQIEAAGAVFFLPAVAIFFLWQKRRIKDTRPIFLAALLFLATLVPQILFNFRHQGILFASFKRFLLAQPSFQADFWQVITERLRLYYHYFFPKIFLDRMDEGLAFVIFFAVFAILRRKIFASTGAKILLLWLAAPLVGFLFYRGNQGFVWDYYFAGVYPVFFLLLGGLATEAWKEVAGRATVLAFLAIFLWANLVQLNIYYQIGIGITLKDQLPALDWVYQDATGKPFNVDVYVPPVIPYAYDYLFLWYGNSRFGQLPRNEQVSLLYTLYEKDTAHPERLKDWLVRQQGIGSLEEEASFGDIVVQRRTRL